MKLEQSYRNKLITDYGNEHIIVDKNSRYAEE